VDGYVDSVDPDEALRQRLDNRTRMKEERMARWGYTMLTEQPSPDQLVRDIRLAEEPGFDFSVSSDRYQPWLESQGYPGYAWSILGAAAQATESTPSCGAQGSRPSSLRLSWSSTTHKREGARRG